jgi:CRP/FNR family transcriptional regulator, cyclic AMP receptor protein
VQWPSVPAKPPGQGERIPSRYCYLLDVDADLADAFDIRMRLVVRQVATARVLEVPVDSGSSEDRFGVGDRGLGALILDGLFALEVHVGGRTATELLGPGDLMQYPSKDVDQLLEREVTRRALVPSRVAVLDREFLDRVRPWPEVTLSLLRRSHKRAVNLNFERAVCSHPSLELRLALLLWHLAERWGRVEPGGVHLQLPLTHALLGRLVAAERPSVSRSLGQLYEHGLVTGGAGDWHLVGSAQGCMDALGSRSVERLHRHHENRA